MDNQKLVKEITEVRYGVFNILDAALAKFSEFELIVEPLDDRALNAKKFSIRRKVNTDA